MKKYTVLLERYQERKSIYTYERFNIGDFVYINGNAWKVWAIV